MSQGIHDCPSCNCRPLCPTCHLPMTKFEVLGTYVRELPKFTCFYCVKKEVTK